MNPLTLMSLIIGLTNSLKKLQNISYETTKTVRNMKLLAPDDFVVLYDIHFKTKDEAEAFISLENIITKLFEDMKPPEDKQEQDQQKQDEVKPEA